MAPKIGARRHFFHTSVGLVLTVASAAAGLMPEAQAQGRTVLTLTGQVGSGAQAGRVDFDMAALRAFKQHTFTTATPWDARPVEFSGPLLRDVLASAAAKGQELSAVAVNDYAVSLPFDDATRFDPILAIQLDGKDIPPRTRGPVFLIYPFNAHPDLNTPTYHARSIWQLRTLKVQ